jgi:DNA-binding response OmpR family regulator
VRVLMISDDELIKQLLCGVLRERGHELLLSEDVSATWQLARGDIDLVLYDLQEATPARWQRLEHWKHVFDLPLIILGPWDGEENAVRALKLGADDYVARPLHLLELLARMMALLRRSRREFATVRESTLRQDHDLDVQTARARMTADRVNLSPTESRILDLLLRYKGKLVLSQDLIKEVWGEEQLEKKGKTLKIHIWHLRQKIEDDPHHPKIIVNRRGLGYAFQDEEPGRS